jgi:hypothetical protein
MRGTISKRELTIGVEILLGVGQLRSSPALFWRSKAQLPTGRRPQLIRRGTRPL